MNYKVMDQEPKLVVDIAHRSDNRRPPLKAACKTIQLPGSGVAIFFPLPFATCYLFQAFTSFIVHLSGILMADTKACVVYQRFLFLVTNMCCCCHRQSQQLGSFRENLKELYG